MEEFEHKIERYFSEIKKNEKKYYDSDFFDQVIDIVLSENMFEYFTPIAKHYVSIHGTSLNLKKAYIEYIAATESSQEAITLARELYIENSTHFQVTFLLGLLLHQEDNHSEALIFLLRAKRMIGDQTGIYTMGVELEEEDKQELDTLIAESYYFLGNYSSCLSYFEESEDYACLLDINLHMMLDSYCRLHQIRRGIQHFETIQHHYDLDLESSLAHLYEKLGHWEKALSLYRIVIDRRIYGQREAKQYADLLFKTTRFEEALKLYLDIFVDSEEPLPEICLNIARCYTGLHKCDQAIPYYEECIRIDPHLTAAYAYYARHLINFSLFAQAIEVLSRAIFLGLTHKALSETLLYCLTWSEMQAEAFLLIKNCTELPLDQSKASLYLDKLIVSQPQSFELILKKWTPDEPIYSPSILVHQAVKTYHSKAVDPMVIQLFAKAIARDKLWLKKFSEVYPDLADKSPFKELIKANVDWFNPK